MLAFFTDLCYNLLYWAYTLCKCFAFSLVWIYTCINILDYYWVYVFEWPFSVCCHVTSSIQQVFLDTGRGACEYNNLLSKWLQHYHYISLPPLRKWNEMKQSFSALKWYGWLSWAGHDVHKLPNNKLGAITSLFSLLLTPGGDGWPKSIYPCQHRETFTLSGTKPHPLWHWNWPKWYPSRPCIRVQHFLTWSSSNEWIIIMFINVIDGANHCKSLVNVDLWDRTILY